MEEKRLKRSLKTVYPQLTTEEIERNVQGPNRMFVCHKHDSFDFVKNVTEVGLFVTYFFIEYVVVLVINLKCYVVRHVHNHE